MGNPGIYTLIGTFLLFVGGAEKLCCLACLPAQRADSGSTAAPGPRRASML
jgi:hypothetical protein